MFRLIRVFVKMFIIWSLVATSIIYFGSKSSGHNFSIFKSFGMAVGIGWTELKKGIDENSETITSPQQIDDGINNTINAVDSEVERHSKYSKEEAVDEFEEGFDEYNKN